MIGVGKEVYREPGGRDQRGLDLTPWLGWGPGSLPWGLDVWRMREPFLPGRRRDGLGGGNCICKEHRGRGREERRGGEKSAGRDQMKKLLGECRGRYRFLKTFRKNSTTTEVVV